MTAPGRTCFGGVSSLDLKSAAGSSVAAMSMEMTAWTSLRHAMHQREQRPFSRETLRRTTAFARPHRPVLTWYLSASVVSAVLTVAAPVLAGRVIDTIVGGGSTSRVVRLAVLI